MVRKNRGVAVMVGACACFLAALGAGGDLRYMGFSAAGVLGPSENPDVDGVCKIKFNAAEGYSRLHLTVTGLQAGVTYGVKMDGDGAGFSDPQAFTANPAGHGAYTFEVPGQAAANTFVQIYVWDGFQGYPMDTGSDIFTVTNDELRANAVVSN